MAANIPKMTRRQALAWRRGYLAVNRVEQASLRVTSLDVKARQVGALMGLGQGLGWTTSSGHSLLDIRRRWRRLREHYHVGR